MGERYVAICVQNDAEWAAFVKTIGAPAWASDKKFANLMGRLDNIDELEKNINERTASRDAYEVMNLMQKGGIAAGVAQNGRDLSNDPQLAANNFYQKLDVPTVGDFSYAGIPVRMSETPYEIKRTPLLGEYNEFVSMNILGLSDEEFVTLIADGAFE